MTLFKLKTAPLILIEDDNHTNVIPLLLELTENTKNTISFFCYDQPISVWKQVFRNKSNISYYEDFESSIFCTVHSNNKHSVIIDSVNHMALCLGWNRCLQYLKKLQMDSNIMQIILILHKDCLSRHSKLQIHLNHIANAIVSYDLDNPCKIKVQLKKSGKLIKSEEILAYDNRTSMLKCTPVVKEEKNEEELERPSPGNLSTFKIEVEQTEKLEKYKLKLPYMSKINEGESKVYYEPDAVDDWDEEDPDEDLDI